MIDSKKPLDVTLNGHSTVFDIARLTIPQQKALVEWFCKTIFEHQVKQLSTLREQHPEIPIEDLRKEKLPKYFIFFEEAHTYFPQGCMRARAYENTVRLLTQGRNYNVRIGCVTQFASLLDKNAMRYMNQRYFGATSEPNDTEYISKFLPKTALVKIATEMNPKKELEKSTRQELASMILSSLKAGQFIYKHRNRITQIQIKPFRAFLQPRPRLQTLTTPKKPIKQTHKPQTIKGLLVLGALLTIAFIMGVLIR